MKRTNLIILLILAYCAGVTGEDLTQTIRGRVIDKDSNFPLPGATVLLKGSDPLIGTITDLDGYFVLSSIPLGRQSLSVSYVGYESIIVPDIIINSAKEAVVTVHLTESLNSIDEVVITPGTGKPKNEMASVSSRSITVEQTKRYPAAISDLGRLALVFPGVSMGNEDASNEIIIRGNSSNGLLWRMEGIEIPNPNHFAVEGCATGYVSILSSSMLSKSDFMTGAFPAEYGNALSGVFDISLRNGNNKKREFAIQAGLLGVDVTAEGPFSNKYLGSYLINFRYSTMGLLTKLSYDSGGDRYLNYRDLSYKLHFPTRKAGNFSLWGIGGPCMAYDQPSQDPEILLKEASSRNHTSFRGKMQAHGLTHVFFPNKNSYLRSVLSYSENGSLDDDSLRIAPYPASVSVLRHRQLMEQSTVRASLLYNNKISKRFTLRTGINMNHLMYNYQDKNYLENKVFLNDTGSTQTFQSYILGKYRVNENLTIFSGLHYMQLLLNGSYSIEPRFSMQWNIKPKHSLGFGFGKHSRHELISTYMTLVPQANGEYANPNKDLDLTKAIHFVLSYDYSISRNLHFRAELYYQWLYDVPVMNHEPYPYAPINAIFPDDTLFNHGNARNYGLELTMERYFADGFYFLATTSLFSSKMNPNFVDRWYSTKYNTRFVQNMVGGREFKIGRDGQHTLGANAKILWSGGQRGARVDTLERVVYHNECFEEQFNDYFRIDAGIYIKINKKNTAHYLAFDVQNLTNRKNILNKPYDPVSGRFEEEYMTGLIPRFQLQN